MTKKLLIFFILIMYLYLHTDPAYSENTAEFHDNSIIKFNFDLCGDVLYKLDSSGRIKLFDKVAAISRDKDTIYYIRSSGEKWIAGFLKDNSDINSEFDLQGRYEKLFKFAGCSNIFYYLVQPVKENIDDKSENKPLFIRFNPDQMNFQIAEGVEDFILVDGKSFVLLNNNLYFNGALIPVSLSGKLKISGVIDSRIAVISDTTGTELVDLVAEKSIYQYLDNLTAVEPDQYNLIVEIADNIPATDTTLSDSSSNSGSSVYYEIRIDGAEENRTETGTGELTKTLYSTLAPGRYHIIKAERWELDKTKGRYVRMNNILQPDELKIFIPEKRIMKIKIEFNGAGYKINQSVLFK